MTAIGTAMAVLFSSFQLLAHGCLEIFSWFASPNALVPRVLNLSVVSGSRSAFFKPRTSAATTTHFPGFLDGNAFAAYRTDGDCWCVTCGKLLKTEKGGKRGGRGVRNRAKRNCVRYFIKIHQPRTHICMPPLRQATCNPRFCCQHLHTSCTKRRQERNN